MNVIEILFIKLLGITRNKNGLLELPFNKNIESYFQTQHAGSQFTLAETASIDYLQTNFPLLIGKTIPVLRRSEVKFKKLSKCTIVAFPQINNNTKNNFEEELKMKSRAIISVKINLIDTNDVTTFIGTIEWFVNLR